MKCHSMPVSTCVQWPAMHEILPPPLELACLVSTLYSRSWEKVVEILPVGSGISLSPCLPLRCSCHMDYVPQKADLPAHHPHEVQAPLQVPRPEVMAGSRLGYPGGFPPRCGPAASDGPGCLTIHSLHTWQVNSVVNSVRTLFANAGHDLLRWSRFPCLVSR